LVRVAKVFYLDFIKPVTIYRHLTVALRCIYIDLDAAAEDKQFLGIDFLRFLRRVALKMHKDFGRMVWYLLQCVCLCVSICVWPSRGVVVARWK